MNNKNIIYLHLMLIIFFPFLIYFNFLWGPIVFDDLYFFNGTEHHHLLNKFFDFSLRWFPYATFEWTRVLLGDDVVWLHLGNSLIHASNGVLLYFFLKFIFYEVIDSRYEGLSLENTAFFASLIFLLHPASVYSVAYLSQRSMLMSTFFAIAMLIIFLKSVLFKNKIYLYISVALYGLSVLCKEHAIMLPVIAFAASVLIKNDFKSIVKFSWPYFLLCFFIAIYVLYTKQSEIDLYGSTYELGAPEMLARLKVIDPYFNIKLAYPLSIFTQAGLFFKYLMVWIVPSPRWMSIDIYETFSTRFFLFPQIIGATLFVIFPLPCIYLLLRKGLVGLLGFAILCPWVLFFTEFSTIRIQESFVIYRSYIWIVFLSCALPFFVQKISPKKSIILLSIIALFMIPLTLQRLTSFSHPLLLWDDAARLVEGKENRPGVERVYHNRGLAFFKEKQYKLALDDFNKALEIWPQYSFVYNDRGAVYLEMQDYQQALVNFDQSIVLKPDYFRPYLGRARAFELQGKPELAKEDYAKACAIGVVAVCARR
ncbi:tetratricopeptide repeat protein [Janthinobacterium sp. B9-8]|uniref:tetratricopeptide repeat protein n=1 Tax=Janthinobacterium sp. B9-8 TaxID=1236179 RepID=UPI00061D29CD|nr:tetratricopeptide repeat protein [Janthinobacterium sp. B9-8]AMC36287.1 hypothetical protein VN23_17650 [Janthinobacterium sp. B9-8]